MLFDGVRVDTRRACNEGAALFCMNSPVVWIESNSWELDFFGLPRHIPWPAVVDPAIATRSPFEIEHLLHAIDALGPDATAPWTSFAQAAAHFEELAEALEDAEIVRSRELLDEVEKIHPGTSFVVFHRAYIARHEGRTDDAVQLYKAAAEKTPAVAEIWNNLGVMLTFAGQREEAIDAFKRALQCAPNDRMAMEGLAQLRVLVKLVRKQNDSESPVFVDVPTFRRITTEQIPALAREHEQLVAFGEQLVRDGVVPDVGVSALEKAHELKPADPRTTFALAGAYRAAGQLEKLRALFSLHTQNHPSDPDGFAQLAQAQRELDDLPASREALERALTLDPNHQAALAYFFDLSPEEHDPKKEQELTKFAEERASWMAFIMASILARRRGDTRAGVRWAERAVDLAPAQEEPLLQYAMALGEARDIAGLARLVKPKVDSGEFSKRLDWHYAHVLRQLGLHRDALSAIRRAADGENLPDDFKKACATAIEAWTGVLTGTGVPLEIHPSGVLLRPVVVSLDEGDGGIVLPAGSQLPCEGAFTWRATSAETDLALQQGQTGSVRDPQPLGIYKLRDIHATPDRPTTIECHVTALPDGALHLRAGQNGRRLRVAWTPPKTKMR
jgi:tetratricopeptide (TPR) repeat protein